MDAARGLFAGLLLAMSASASATIAWPERGLVADPVKRSASVGAQPESAGV